MATTFLLTDSHSWSLDSHVEEAPPTFSQTPPLCCDWLPSCQSYLESCFSPPQRYSVSEWPPRDIFLLQLKLMKCESSMKEGVLVSPQDVSKSNPSKDHFVNPRPLSVASVTCLKLLRIKKGHCFFITKDTELM